MTFKKRETKSGKLPPVTNQNARATRPKPTPKKEDKKK